MRPFQFFFLVSIGLILFFAIAKMILIAMFFAAIMSIIFFGLKTIAAFFRNLSWNNSKSNYQTNRLETEQFSFNRDFSDHFYNQSIAPWEKEQIIKIN